ncbi:MAG: hypothetical protein EXS06_04125 [Planctomycetaceae bacterium]|nr:hypothetical protein [Planctomycetaceae bacterium]
MPRHSIASASIQERPPLEVGVVRGKETESTHSIHAVIARDDGSLVAWHGDPQRKTFPRSAVKSIQALALLESGAVDQFGFTPAELALACSSHAGTPLQVGTARSMLAKSGFEPEALECGAHWPLDEPSARALARVGAEPSPLHNNCSGKHAGFLAVARHLGIGTRNHVERHRLEVLRAVRDQQFVAKTQRVRPNVGAQAVEAQRVGAKRDVCRQGE